MVKECNPTIREMTKEEWRKTHSNYKTIDKTGQPWLLINDPNLGTCLTKVKIKK